MPSCVRDWLIRKQNTCTSNEFISGESVYKWRNQTHIVIINVGDTAYLNVTVLACIVLTESRTTLRTSCALNKNVSTVTTKMILKLKNKKHESRPFQLLRVLKKQNKNNSNLAYLPTQYFNEETKCY